MSSLNPATLLLRPAARLRKKDLRKRRAFSAACYAGQIPDSAELTRMLPRDPRQGAFFDLSDRVKLRLTGADRLRFMNGQITNDVQKADDSHAIAACILNARGKLNAQV